MALCVAADAANSLNKEARDKMSKTNARSVSSLCA